MQDNLNSLAPVAALAVEERSQFIWKCYAHVVGALLALVAIEVYLFSSGVAWAIAQPMLNSPMESTNLTRAWGNLLPCIMCFPLQ